MIANEYTWIKDEKDANYWFGGEKYVITDADIERLKNGEIINFVVNSEYGCILMYEKEA